MRVGINAFTLRRNGGGARFVFFGLLKYLLREDSDNKYIIFIHNAGLRLVHQFLYEEFDSSKNIYSRVEVKTIYSLNEVYKWCDEIDIYFCPLNNIQPRPTSLPIVAILHDILEHHYPQYFETTDLAGRMEDYPDIAFSATLLIAISEFCKQSFVSKLGIKEEKIRVCYNAPQAALVDCFPHDMGLWHRSNLPSKFLYYPSNTYHHKDHKCLLDAMLYLRENDGIDLNIVFTGFELPYGYQLQNEICRRGLKEHCFTFSDLKPKEIRYLYKHALAIVFPSRFEGFGMPVVEAMRLKTPVICSKIPSLLEVTGGNAHFFEPGNIGQICSSIKGVYNEMKGDVTTLDNAYKYSQRFTWEKSAVQMLSVFEEAINKFGSDIEKKCRDKGLFPKIGVVINFNNSELYVSETLHSVLACGYPNLEIILKTEVGESAEFNELINQLDVKIWKDGSTHNLLAMIELAEIYDIDLLYEIRNGASIEKTVIKSILWAYFEYPKSIMYLAEVLQSNNGEIHNCRLSKTGNGHWKMRGWLHPEMIILNAKNIISLKPKEKKKWNDWSIDWRHNFLCELHMRGDVCIVKRTLATTPNTENNLFEKIKQHRISANLYYRIIDNNLKFDSTIILVEPMLRLLAKFLPATMRSKGKKIWIHLKNS